MRYTRTILLVCVLMVALAGCLSVEQGDPSDQDSTVREPTRTDTTATEEPVCTYTTEGDPAIGRCLVSERPPDVSYRNWDSAVHNLSLRVLRGDSSVAFRANATLEPGEGARWYNVVDEPGEYALEVTKDGTESREIAWTAEERYLGSGGPKWSAVITESGELTFRSIGHQ